MKMQELYQNLNKLGIREDQYYIQGMFGSTDDEDKLSMIIRKENDILFEIYYKERGQKEFIRHFSDEDKACDFFYEFLKNEKEIEDRY